jgi:hypothetical protein
MHDFLKMCAGKLSDGKMLGVTAQMLSIEIEDIYVEEKTMLIYFF